ncbi:MAG TPA: DUF4157 domain-containing protein, partial [Coleofasciculaceae cyanobacterium]
MTRESVDRTQLSPQQKSSWLSSTFQRATAQEEARSPNLPEPNPFHQSRFQHDFSRIPVSSGDRPVVQPRLRIAGSGNRDEQQADRPIEPTGQQKLVHGMQQHQVAVKRSSQLSEQHLNRTGMPDDLKAGIENISGMSMDDVKVHYNSTKPAQLNALAYTQGTEIHVGPGQEQHLPHEGWHVVQQKQRRVNPTIQTQGVPINDDQGLEHEADVMGAKAMQMRRSEKSAFELLSPTAYPCSIQRMQGVSGVSKASDAEHEGQDDDAEEDLPKHLSKQEQSVAKDLAKIKQDDDGSNLDPVAAQQALSNLGLGGDVPQPKEHDEIADLEELIKTAHEVGLTPEELAKPSQQLRKMKLQRDVTALLDSEAPTIPELERVLQEGAEVGFEKGVSGKVNAELVRAQLIQQVPALRLVIMPV